MKEAIETLSEERSRVALDFINYLEEREEWEATRELLFDKKLLMDYKAAKEEIKKGNTVKWTAIKRNVGFRSSTQPGSDGLAAFEIVGEKQKR